jgi:rhamnosyltransferase
MPIYNGGALLIESLRLLLLQVSAKDVYIIDSSSDDGSALHVEQFGLNYISIPKSKFNHGGTRNLFIEEFGLDCEYEIIVYLTQDALLEPDAIQILLEKFELHPSVGIVYGRQIPHEDANPIASHARIYNYSNLDLIKDSTKVELYGIKSVFISNSFASYRIDVLKKAGFFPVNTILCEDMYVASKVIGLNYSIFYSSGAMVRHSHNYSIWQEFSRYFDIGVFHSKESWIQDRYGGAGSEGIKYIFSEIKYLIEKRKFGWLSISILANLCKFFGMFLGRRYRWLGKGIIMKISMHKSYW